MMVVEVEGSFDKAYTQATAVLHSARYHSICDAEKAAGSTGGERRQYV
jgi:hypothetical protein